MAKLRLLDVRQTLVEGSLDGLQGCTRLRSLRCEGLRNLGKCSLLPGLKGCRELRVVDLSQTCVEGPLEGLCEECPNLAEVELEHCKQLRGSILPLAQCRGLRSLDVTMTNLSGGLCLLTTFAAQCPELRTVKALHCPHFLDPTATATSPNNSSNWRRSAGSMSAAKFLQQLNNKKKLDVTYTD